MSEAERRVKCSACGRPLGRVGDPPLEQDDNGLWLICPHCGVRVQLEQRATPPGAPKAFGVMYTRPPKLSPLDTIHYEIGMLRFCYGWLVRPLVRSVRVLKVDTRYATRPTVQEVYATPEDDERVGFVYLEAFLLHYRNLVEFLSGEHDRRRNALSTKHPERWAARKLSDEEERSIRQPAKHLDDQWWQEISKNLQHCTVDRHENDVSWNVTDMMDELEQVVREFEKAFPNPRSAFR